MMVLASATDSSGLSGRERNGTIFSMHLALLPEVPRNIENWRFHDARRNRHHEDVVPDQLTCSWQHQRHHLTLLRSIRSLTDLTVEHRHRSSIDDHAMLAIHIRLALAHDIGSQVHHIETDDQVGLRYASKFFQPMRPVFVRNRLPCSRPCHRL